MIGYILLTIIGVELGIMHGWYLALIIIGIVFKIISFGLDCIKAGLKID